MRRHKQDGFTLVEVLVSLMIFSVAIIGLTQAGTESTRATSLLTQKTYAGIVADNRVVWARNTTVKPGLTSGEERAGGMDFSWEVETVETEIKDFYQITVRVNRKPRDLQLIELKAFRYLSSAQ